MSGLWSEDWRRWESVHSVWMVTVAAGGVRLMLLVRRSLLAGGCCLLCQRPGMTQRDQQAGALPVVWRAGLFNARRSSLCFTAQVFHLTSGLLQHYDLSIVHFWRCAHCRCQTCSLVLLSRDPVQTFVNYQFVGLKPTVVRLFAVVSYQFVDLNLPFCGPLHLLVISL